MTPDQLPKSLQSFPSVFQRAIMADTYDGGTSKFSVTKLISPPQRTWLKTLGEEIRSPYSMFAALMGTAMHSVIETHADPAQGEIAEQRYYRTINVDGVDVSVSGQVDFIENGCVSDWKLTSGVQDQAKPDHVKQLQMNGRLAELNGIEVRNVSVIYVQKDWSHLRSTVDPSYPQTPFKIFVMDYDRELADRLFETTVREHQEASLGKPRMCSPEEQWAKPDSFALMKPGGKRASKVCDTRAEAEELRKKDQYIEVRKGEKTYCASFCSLKHLCPQFKRESAQNHNQSEP